MTDKRLVLLQGASAATGSVPSSLPDLKRSVMECLQEALQDKKPTCDMWGHFGIVHLKVPEGNIMCSVTQYIPFRCETVYAQLNASS